MIHHATALRNRGPIAEKLREILRAEEKSGRTVQSALEVASGTGAHIEVFGELKYKGDEVEDDLAEFFNRKPAQYDHLLCDSRSACI